METDRKRVYVPLELFTVSDESEGVFDLKKG